MEKGGISMEEREIRGISMEEREIGGISKN
jgi:hypothetical protein